MGGCFLVVSVIIVIVLVIVIVIVIIFVFVVLIDDHPCNDCHLPIELLPILIERLDELGIPHRMQAMAQIITAQPAEGPVL